MYNPTKAISLVSGVLIIEHQSLPLSTQHVLVLAYPDVDALCACKILQALFKADDVQHTVVAVSGRTQLKEAFASHTDQVEHPAMQVQLYHSSH